MARIAESEIERLKREVSVAAAGGGARGQAEAQRRGTDRAVPVPRRHEPSLVITPEKNLWHCLGACGEAATSSTG